MASRTPLPLVRKQVDKMRLERLNENQNARPLIVKLAELFNVRGDGAIAFSQRLELRRDIRALLADLDCSGDLDGE